MKHTPGPWHLMPAEVDKDYLRIRGSVLGGRYKIANVHATRFPEMPSSVLQLREDEESAANARLIATAPDLLAALQDCVLVMERELGGLQVIQPELAQARAAIAKATPEAA